MTLPGPLFWLVTVEDIGWFVRIADSYGFNGFGPSSLIPSLNFTLSCHDGAFLPFKVGYHECSNLQTVTGFWRHHHPGSTSVDSSGDSRMLSFADAELSIAGPFS